MNNLTVTCLSIGSNQGNRLQYLQQSVQYIFERVGKIQAISKVYATPSWGFEGDDFLNACVVVQTHLPAQLLLKEILQIEIELGRVRLPTLGYQNRIIDIDILFYGNEKHQYEHLVIPHPKLTQRNFVLLPLLDVAKNIQTLVDETSLQNWIDATNDSNTIEVFKGELSLPSLPKITSTYVAIEGNIGAGKTSLASMISIDYNAKLITERFKDNPFLPKFYEDQSRYAFPLEMSFLADRHQQLLDDISQYDLFSDFVVADYDVYKSLIFAQVTLQEDEFRLYKKVFDIMYKEMPKPDLYIYLYQNTERLLENIKKRGRSYEQNIAPDYLERINKGYLNYIKNQQQTHYQIIDISELDFVANRSDYLKMLRIFSTL